MTKQEEAPQKLWEKIFDAIKEACEGKIITISGMPYYWRRADGKDFENGKEFDEYVEKKMLGIENPFNEGTTGTAIRED